MSARAAAFTLGKKFGKAMLPGFPDQPRTVMEDEQKVTYTPRSKVTFGVTGAKEHSGAAYGVRTSGSELAPRVPVYGKEDIRGVSTTKKLRPTRTVHPYEQQEQAEQLALGPGERGGRSQMALEMGARPLALNPGPRVFSDMPTGPEVPQYKTSDAVDRGYNRTPPSVFFGQHGDDSYFQPSVLDDPLGRWTDMPYTAPKNMGNPPRPRRT